MAFREKKLYHQIHPVKLATDIGVTPIFLFSLSLRGFESRSLAIQSPTFGR